MIIGNLSFAARRVHFGAISISCATIALLALDPVTGLYSATATPSTGSETLVDFYARLIAGEVSLDLGDHSVF